MPLMLRPSLLGGANGWQHKRMGVVRTDRVPVQSRSLASVRYNPETSTLEIEFLNGSIYQYFGVPRDVYENLLNAASKGSYFDQYVRKAGYHYTKVS